MMRGRVVSLQGVAAERIKADEQVAWVLEGDRGITFARRACRTARPRGRRAGGPRTMTGRRSSPSKRASPRASGSRSATRIAVNVLGRTSRRRSPTCAARMADARASTSSWCSRRTLFAARRTPCWRPIDLPGRRRPPSEEAALLQPAAAAYPTVTSVRVKDALEADRGPRVAACRGDPRRELRRAGRAAFLVLAGALAAGHRARLYDAVVLKTLGRDALASVGAYAPGIRRSRARDRAFRHRGRGACGLAGRDAGHEPAIRSSDSRRAAPRPPPTLRGCW